MKIIAKLKKSSQNLWVTQVAISERLKATGYIQKQGNWVPRELKPWDVERWFYMSEMLLERHKKKLILHRIVTGDEKWIHYDNPKPKNHMWNPANQPNQRQSRISMARM